MLRSPFWLSTFAQHEARACNRESGGASTGSPRAAAVAEPPRAPPESAERGGGGLAGTEGAGAAAVGAAGGVATLGGGFSPVTLQAASGTHSSSSNIATRMGKWFRLLERTHRH